MKRRSRYTTADEFDQRARKLADRTDRQARRVSESLRRAAEGLQAGQNGSAPRRNRG